MDKSFGLNALRHIRLLPWTRSLAQAYDDTIPPASPLLHPISAPFNHSAISTERLRRGVRQHHEFQSPQRGSMVWYSSGQQKMFVTLFTVIQTPLHPSDRRSTQEKVKPTFVCPQTLSLVGGCITR